MIKTHVWFATVIAVTAGCTDTMGPAIDGRWAARGIELVRTGGGPELRLPCASPVRVPRWTRFDASGRIRFSGAVRQYWYGYDFVFAGQLRGDTLDATMTVNVPGQAPSVASYLMTRDGDSELGRIMCLA